MALEMLTERGGGAGDQGLVEAVRFEKAVTGTWGCQLQSAEHGWVEAGCFGCIQQVPWR